MREMGNMQMSSEIKEKSSYLYKWMAILVAKKWKRDEWGRKKRPTHANEWPTQRLVIPPVDVTSSPSAPAGIFFVKLAASQTKTERVKDNE